MRRRLALLVGLMAAALFLAGCEGGEQPREYTAIFGSSTNLFVGSQVRVLGVTVGEVLEITPEGDRVRVEFTVAREQPLPADVTARIQPVSLVGERFVQLDPPYTGGPELEDGAVIPRERTRTAAEFDEVLASLEEFLAGLDPDTLDELVGTLADTLAGQGEGVNRLLEDSADTVRVLADASDDLTAVVAELADLNETLATRDDRIGPLLDDLSTVLTTLTEEKGEIIEGLDNVQRLTAELRPLLDEHTEPLVDDLEVLATTLSTVDRNLARIGDLYRQSRRLFTGFGVAFDYPRARLPLQNQTGELDTIIERRLRERLAGVCLRLDQPECSDPGFFEAHTDALRCSGEASCATERDAFGDALARAIRAMPPEAQRQLEAEAEQRASEEQEEQQPGGEPPSEDGASEAPSRPDDAGSPGLPLPDPRLEDDLPDGSEVPEAPAGTSEDSDPPWWREWLGAS